MLLEVGPGNALTTLAQAARRARHGRAVIAPSLPQPREREPDAPGAAGRARRAVAGRRAGGLEAASQGREQRRRVPLPTYPFERERYWVDAAGPAGRARRRPAAAHGQATQDVADWFYVARVEARAARRGRRRSSGASRLLVLRRTRRPGRGVAERAAAEGRGRRAAWSRARGLRAREDGDVHGSRRIARRTCRRWSEDLEDAGPLRPRRVVHLWSLAAPRPRRGRLGARDVQERGFYSLPSWRWARAPRRPPGRRVEVVLA